MNAAAGPGPRLRALDVFRGATVALMILVNNPGTWVHLYPPLAHAAWHGLTPTDLVFPFFLFAVGNALALVMPRHAAGPAAAFWRKVAWRTLLIFGIGLALNASPFVRWDAAGQLTPRAWETLRVMGVLQRIALAYGAAAAIVWLLGARGTRTRPVLWAAAALLAGYWAACLGLGGADPYSLEGFFGTAIDRALLGPGHLYRGEGVPFDPEGLASTVPAVAQVLLGWWAGTLVARARFDAAMLVRLFVAAVALGVLAYLWQLGMPLNKKLWTSSYVLATTSLALMALAATLHLVPDRLAPAAGIGARAGDGLARFFELFGRNPLFIFVLSGLLPRMLSLVRWPDGVDATGAPAWITPLPWLYRSAFAGIGSDPRLGSLLFALASVAFYAAIAWGMDRRRWYIKV